MKLIYRLTDRVVKMQFAGKSGRYFPAICIAPVQKNPTFNLTSLLNAKCIAKVLALLLLIPFLSGKVFAQHDFKLYSDGFTFEKLDKDNVILKVFLTAYEIGSITTWNDDIHDFRISYNADFDVVKPVAYTPELQISETGTEPLLMSISFVIPKSAQNVFLKFPQKYGGLKTKIFSKSYNAQQSSLHNDFASSLSLQDCMKLKNRDMIMRMQDYEYHFDPVICVDPLIQIERTQSIISKNLSERL